jgi:hypothetical protein
LPGNVGAEARGRPLPHPTKRIKMMADKTKPTSWSKEGMRLPIKDETRMSGHERC